MEGGCGGLVLLLASVAKILRFPVSSKAEMRRRMDPLASMINFFSLTLMFPNLALRNLCLPFPLRSPLEAGL